MGSPQALITQMAQTAVRNRRNTLDQLKLQRVGLIRYVRGHITVLDRMGWEKRSCECYSVVKKEYSRLFPHKLAR
jgi:hypothetical protein